MSQGQIQLEVRENYESAYKSDAEKNVYYVIRTIVFSPFYNDETDRTYYSVTKEDGQAFTENEEEKEMLYFTLLLYRSAGFLSKGNDSPEGGQDEYITGYNEHIEAVLDNAEKLSGVSIFSSYSPDSAAKLQKIIKDYTAMLNVQLYSCNDRAVSAVCGYAGTFYACMAMLVIIMYVILKERENGMWELLYTTRNGRFRLGLCRAGIIAGAAAVLAVLNEAAVVTAAFLLYGGFDCIFMPIQNIQCFQDFTLKMTAAQYLLFSCLYEWLILAGISMAVWLLFVLFRNRNAAVAAAAVIFGTEFILYKKIPPQSVYHVFMKLTL